MVTRRLAAHVLLLSATWLAPLHAQSYNGKTASEWVGDLGSENDTTREDAISSLVAMEQRAVRPLLRALGDERAPVRGGAAMALGRLGAMAAEGREPLEKLRADADLGVAHAAKVAWIRVQVDAARVPPLIEALADRDWDVQLAAADVLEALGKQAATAAPALVALLRKPGGDLDRTVEQPRARSRPWNLRRSAALALGAIGVVDGIDSAAVLAEVLAGTEPASQEGAAVALGRLGPAATSALPVMLARLRSDASWNVRRAIAAALPRIIGDASTQEQLDQAIATALAAAQRDVEPGVRRLALEFLGHCGARASGAAAALARSMPRLAKEQEQVARAIGAMGSAAKEAAPALVEACRDLEGVDDWDTRSARHAILECLAEIDPQRRSEVPDLDALLREREQPKAVADVQRHQEITQALAGLQDKTEQARLEAMNRLGELRATAATSSVREFLGESHSLPERCCAARTLMALDAIDTAPLLRPLLQAKESELQYCAALALAQFADSESMPKVTKFLRVVAVTASKDELWMLGNTGVPGLAPVMQRIMANPMQTMHRRWGAVTALTMLAVPDTAPSIADFVDNVASDGKLKEADRSELLNNGLRALTLLDPAPNRERFARFVESDDKEVHTSALLGLAMLGDAEAKAKLLRESPHSWSPAFDLPPELRQKLESVHVRLSQVKGCTLREVAATLQQALGVPVEVDAPAGHPIYNGRFGNYIDLIGFHPSALTVLFSASMATFSGGAVVPEVTRDKIVLRPPAGRDK
jgi:HEAT repeat protein